MHWPSGPRPGLPTCTRAQETQRHTPARIPTRARARARNSVPLGGNLPNWPRNCGSESQKQAAVPTWPSRPPATSGMHRAEVLPVPGAQAETPRALTRARAPRRHSGDASHTSSGRGRGCARPPLSGPSHAPRSGMRSARGERAGPLRRARRSSPAPPAAPPQREVCARSPAALCALLRVGVAAEGGCDGTGRRGWRAAPPPGSPGGRLRAQGRRKEALRGGPERGALPGRPAARSLSARVPPSAAGPSGCPRILARALPSFVLGSAWLAGPLAPDPGRSAERPGPRIARMASVRAAGLLMKTMRPCGRTHRRVNYGVLAGPRGDLGARRQRLPKVPPA